MTESSSVDDIASPSGDDTAPDGLESANEMPPGRRAGSKRLVFGIIAVSIFMSTLDTSIVATALPAIHHGLRATINWAGWTITIYSLGMVVALPVAGRISDQFGRRRVFMFGLALFTTASLLCGFSTDIYMLIVFRALQALGGGAIQPSAAGIIADNFGKDRDRGIGMFGTLSASGQIAGPVFGGLLVGYLSWRWIFFVNIPIGIVVLILIAIYIPESRTTKSSTYDVQGIVFLVSAILFSIYGITSLGDAHASPYSPTFIVPEAIAIMSGFAFFHHAKRVASPFIPLRLLNARGFFVVNGLNFLWGAFGFGVMSLVPLYAEQRYHLHALSAGTLLTARAFGVIVIGTFAALALRRTGYRLPLIVGYSVVALGTLLISFSPLWGISPYVWLSIGAGVTGIGNGFGNPASRNACIQLAPNDVAAISGLRQMFAYIGSIFLVAITTAILNRSGNPGLAQAHMMWVAAGCLLLILVPLVFRVPEHKGTW